MRELDLRIHPKEMSQFKEMDCRVKPGNDGGQVRDFDNRYWLCATRCT